jgi:hypothetical protein
LKMDSWLSLHYLKVSNSMFFSTPSNVTDTMAWNNLSREDISWRMKSSPYINSFCNSEEYIVSEGTKMTRLQ